MASVSKIGANAFTDCKNLERVTLNRISSLGMIVFNNCTSLKTVTMQGTLTDINTAAFQDAAA